MHLAPLPGMRAVQRRVTVRGVGSSVPSPADGDSFDIDNAFSDDDVVEAAPVSGRRPTVSCPPPSGASPASSSRYSYVAPPSRQTVSMLAVPVSSNDGLVSRRRRTLRTDAVQQDVRDTRSAAV